MRQCFDYKKYAKAELYADLITSPAVKEVQNYSQALHDGFELLKRDHLLTCNHILAIQERLVENNAGYRKLPGTTLKNDKTNEIIYTPPQHYQNIVALMQDLESYINDDAFSTLDPLIRMAVIHYQFESIHPFYDGNGHRENH